MIVSNTLNVIYPKLWLLSLTLNYAFPTNHSSSSTTISNKAYNISLEGGEKLMSFPSNATVIPGPKLGIIVDPKSSEKNTLVHNNSLVNNSNVLTEGGDKSIINKVNNNIALVPTISNNLFKNIGHEGGGKLIPISNSIANNASSDKLTIPKQLETAYSSTPGRIIPVLEVTGNGRQKIAPRKGVNNLEYAEFKKLENITTKLPIVKKPLLTEASDDEPLQLEANSKINLTTPAESKVPSLDRFKEFSNNTQQYVVPIVIVILSVPLVTIVISFLLKRGAEWWKYRHYRRMDFLINGIYDT